MASEDYGLLRPKCFEENILTQVSEDGKLTDKAMAALTQYKTSKAALDGPSLPARSLRKEQVIEIFGLKSPVLKLQYDEQYDVPSDLVTMYTAFKSAFGTDGLEKEAVSRCFINLVMLFCITEETKAVKEADTSVLAQSGRLAEGSEESRPTTPIGFPTAQRAEISLYMETNLSRSVVYKNQPFMLRGTADYTLGYAGVAERHSANMIIVEAKRRYDLGSEFGQLLAYMAIVHSARRDEKKESTVVWGVATDGFLYCFWRINNDSSVSRTVDLVWNDPRHRRAIYSTLRAITRAAVISSPTTSPLKGDHHKQFAETFTTSADHMDLGAASAWDDIFVFV